MYKRIQTIGILFLLIFSIVIPISLGNNITITNTKEKLSYPQNFQNILYVGGSGPSNYSKIQDAIDNTSEGDTIFVYDDSSPYNENVRIDKAINLIGENSETTLINGDGETDVIQISREGVNVSGFSIQTTGFEKDYSGINIESNFTTISGNIFLNNNWGILIYENSNNNIIGNKFLNNDCGLCILYGNNIVKDNSFFNDGIYLYSFGNIIENNTVNYKPIVYLENQDNQIINYDCGQIILVNCNYITIQNQRIQKTATGIILYHCNNCIVIGNDVIESVGGLIISNSNNNNISYNEFYQNKNFGITLHSSDYNMIEHNICMENTMGEFSYHGISMSGCDNNTIRNNVIEKNNVGIECSGSLDNIIIDNGIRYNHYIGVKLDSSSENNCINNNGIIGNNIGVILKDVSFNSITENNFVDNDDDLILEIIQYYKLRLNRLPYISGNYWGKARILPKLILGKFTFIWMDVPWGGGITINWIYIDWHPVKEPYDI